MSLKKKKKGKRKILEDGVVNYVNMALHVNRRDKI